MRVGVEVRAALMVKLTRNVGAHGWGRAQDAQVRIQTGQDEGWLGPRLERHREYSAAEQWKLISHSPTVPAHLACEVGVDGGRWGSMRPRGRAGVGCSLRPASLSWPSLLAGLIRMPGAFSLESSNTPVTLPVAALTWTSAVSTRSAAVSALVLVPSGRSSPPESSTSGVPTSTSPATSRCPPTATAAPGAAAAADGA